MDTYWIKKCVAIALFSIVVVFMFSQIHEVTHKQIGSYYGCKGDIQWDFLDVNTTITELQAGENTAFMSTHWDSNCQMTESQILAHSVNEVVGYNIMLALELILILIAMATIFKGEKDPVVIEIHDKTKEKEIELKKEGVHVEFLHR